MSVDDRSTAMTGASLGAPSYSGRSRRLTARLLPSLVPLAGVIGFFLATVVQIALHGADEWNRRLLESALLWLVGVQGLLIGSGHIFAPDRIADSIGWPKGNPFQFEVGLASISYGTLGVLASSYGHQWWLATIVAYSIFYLAAAAGHIRELVLRGNRSPGNAGAVLVLDIVVPLFLVLLYALDRTT
jgi:hypothetical protein